MKTNRIFTVLRLLALGVLVAGFNAKPASAQAFQGNFTLPFATQWGQAVLPPGDYSFTLDSDYPFNRFTVSRGTQHVALIPAQTHSDIKSGRSEMAVENGTVRELRLPSIGMAFHYPAGSPGRRAAPQEPQAAQLIPVATRAAGR